ncbi:head-to-tail connector complex protein [Streptomyces phage Kromp]|uniref:Head-to-tail connector complex protein n=1 Tax=Streptomyces phage Kromp TaxID=2315619 RepID=A0A386K8G7_9CAUD|nr:head-to-tail connector complex protein [Streptomyces phage Kromp]
MSALYEQAAVVVRPAVTTDRYGNKKYDYGPDATRTPVDQLNIQPSGGSKEDTVDRQVTVTGWLLISAPGTLPDLRDTDRVEFDGLVCEVTGKVGRWPVPTAIRHIEAQLKEVD